MANIKERNGSYLITVSNGYDYKGRRIRETVTYIPKAKTQKAIEKEVQKFANDFEDRVKNGEYYSGEKISFEEMYHIWKKNWLDHSDLTVAVKEQYIEKLEDRVIPKIGHLKMTKIKARHIDDILLDLTDSGLSPSTVKKYLVCIRSVFNYAFKKEYIKENPCLRCDPPKMKNKSDELHYFTPDQATRFLDFLDEEFEVSASARTRQDSSGNKYTVAPYSYTMKTSPMFKAYYHLAIYGGFRRGELCALTWNDLDFENQTVSITKAVSLTKEFGQIIKEPKTPKSVRKVKVPRVCFKALEEWKKEEVALSFRLGTQWTGYRGKDFDQNYIFIDQTNGSLMNLHTASNKFKELIERYNLTLEKEKENVSDEEEINNLEKMKLPDIRLHDLRHTTATLLLANGSDIKTVSHRLGHSKTSVTLDVYSHFMEETDQTASDILESVLCKRA